MQITRPDRTTIQIVQETIKDATFEKMVPDHKGKNRRKCKKCVDCDEFILECGSIKCAYCDCPAGVHLVDQVNYIFLFNYGLITLKRALPFLVSLCVARNYKLLLPNSTGLRAVNT